MRRMPTNEERITAMPETFGLQRQKITAVLDKRALAQALAFVVRTLLTSVHTEEDDFWVNIDFDVHMRRGQALEKHARINVYGELLDPYSTNIYDAPGSNELPSGIFHAFCERVE
jgi:hypothetical protein